MKRTIVFAAAMAAAVASFGQGSHYRSGYVRQDGTYVAPSYATNPNSSKLDNYSTKGNVNPYTGAAGTVDPYRAAPTYSTPSQPSTFPSSCGYTSTGQYVCR